MKIRKIKQEDNRLLFITASEAWQFVGKLDKQTAISAVEKKVALFFGGHVQDVKTQAMTHGLQTEAEALNWLSEKTKDTIHKLTPQIYDEILWASPDGGCRFPANITDEDSPLYRGYIVEVKCPNSDTFVKYATQIKDNASLFKVAPNYYYQMQVQMTCFDVDGGYFVAYDPRLSIENKGIAVVIKRDEKTCDMLIENATHYVTMIKDNINKLKNL